MSRYFLRDTTLADLERHMMRPPNFAPRGGGNMILCRFRYRPEDVDCRNCREYRRKRGCGERHCPYLAERLEAGTVTLEELTAELISDWDHPGLKRRAVQVLHCIGQFPFDGSLHVIRMQRMLEGKAGFVSSRWLAAAYLLSASDVLWQQTRLAVAQDRINFHAVRLENIGIQEYILYHTAKGICSGTLGAAAEELADPELTSNNTLRLILCAGIIVRYGPEAINIGRGTAW